MKRKILKTATDNQPLLRLFLRLPFEIPACSHSIKCPFLIKKIFLTRVIPVKNVEQGQHHQPQQRSCSEWMGRRRLKVDHLRSRVTTQTHTPTSSNSFLRPKLLYTFKRKALVPTAHQNGVFFKIFVEAVIKNHVVFHS